MTIESEFAPPKQRIKPYFTATIQIELDEEALADRRDQGYEDAAIIHSICSEIQEHYPHCLTYLGELEFIDCEIRGER